MATSSEGRDGGGGRRTRYVNQPDLPPGPLRDLKDFLYTLYLESGPMTLDSIVSSIAKNDALRGAPSRDTVQRCLGSSELPPSQHNVTAIAFVLADSTRMLPDDAARRAGELWMLAKTPQILLKPHDRVTYFEAIVRRYRLLDLAALTPEAFDENLPILLRQVFVSQLVRRDPPPVELPRELWRRLVGSGDLDLTEVSLGRGRDMEDREDGADSREWLARAHRARQAHMAKPPQPVSQVICDPLQRTFLLLGDPGSGKSSLLRYIAISLGSDVRDAPSEFGAWAGWIPLLVELREYAGLAWRSGPWASGTFLGYLDYLHSRGGPGLPRGVTEAVLRGNSKVVVMFDGLDELFDPQERLLVAQEIVSFAATYSRARVVVTSRPVGVRRDTFDSAGFSSYMLQDLDRLQMQDFATAWFETACRGEQAESAMLVRRLLEAIDNSAPVQELAGNPLLLTILAIIGRRRPLPRERHRVFAHATDVLIQHWDVNRALRDPRADLEFIDEEDKRELLRRVARRIQSGVGSIAANHIHGEDLVDEFRTYLDERYSGFPAGHSKVLAKAMLRQFSERNFILSRFGPGMYGFVHRAFLEYCCADDIVYSFEKAQNLSVHELASEVFGKYAQDSSWREILLLVSGMIDESRMAVVIDYLIDQSGVPANRLSSLGIHWLLAVECLSEVRSVRRLSRQRDHLTEELGRLLTAVRLQLCFGPELVDFETAVPNDHNRCLELLGKGAAVLGSMLGTPFSGNVEWYTRVPRCIGNPMQDSQDREWHESAARAMAKLSQSDETRTLLLQRLFDEDWRVRLAVICPLAEHWPDGEVRAGLTNQTTHPAWRVRLAAVKAIASSWRDISTYQTLSRVVAEDSDPEVVEAAMQALIDEWPSKETREVAKTLFSRSRGRMKASALSSMADAWPDKQCKEVVLTGLSDSSWRVRVAAAKSLIKGWPTASTLQALLANAQDNDIRVRLAVAQALASAWPDELARGLLIACMAEGDPQKARAVQTTWSAFSNRRRNVLRASRVEGDAWKIRLAVLLEMVARWPDDRTRRMLTDYMTNRDSSLFEAAAQALAKGWPDNATRDALRLCIADDNWRVRLAAMQVLVSTWPDVESYEVLRWSAFDANWRVRLAAVRALSNARPTEVERTVLTEVIYRDGREDVVVAAAERLVWGWPDEASRQLLVSRLETDNRIGVLEAIVKIVSTWWPDERTRVRLLDHIHHNSWYVRLAVLEALITTWAGSQTRNVLTGYTRDDNWRVRLSALEALVAGWPDDETATIFVRHSQDSSWRVRHAVRSAYAVGWRSSSSTETNKFED